MEDKTKKKIYFWMFIVSLCSAIFFLFLSISLAEDIDNVNNVYCANFSNITDVKEVRDLAEGFIISNVKNAYNIQFKEIYLVGNTCNSRWWVVAEYNLKVDDEDYITGTSFLEITPVDKVLTKFVTFTCSSLREYEKDNFGVIKNSCSYSWSVKEILGENKQEASNYVDLLK